jgi:hypothetical protein
MEYHSLHSQASAFFHIRLAGIAAKG